MSLVRKQTHASDIEYSIVDSFRATPLRLLPTHLYFPVFLSSIRCRCVFGMYANWISFISVGPKNVSNPVVLDQNHRIPMRTLGRPKCSEINGIDDRTFSTTQYVGLSSSRIRINSFNNSFFGRIVSGSILCNVRLTPRMPHRAYSVHGTPARITSKCPTG